MIKATLIDKTIIVTNDGKMCLREFDTVKEAELAYSTIHDAVKWLNDSPYRASGKDQEDINAGIGEELDKDRLRDCGFIA